MFRSIHGGICVFPLETPDLNHKQRRNVQFNLHCPCLAFLVHIIVRALCDYIDPLQMRFTTEERCT